MTFSGDILKFRKQAEKNFEIAFKKIAFDSAAMIINRTPVDEGRAKGNWHVSINGPVDAVLDIEDEGGSMTIRKAQSDIQGASIGDSIFVLNNLPYIPALEDGHSDQAPNGMVKVTVAQYREITKKVSRSVLNKTVREFS